MYIYTHIYMYIVAYILTYSYMCILMYIHYTYAYVNIAQKYPEHLFAFVRM